MRNGVWLARCGRGIAEGGNLEAAQDDASPAALRRKTPEGHWFSALLSAIAFFGGVFQKLTTRAASHLFMAVQRLQQLLESSPKALRTKSTAACGVGPSVAPNSK